MDVGVVVVEDLLMFIAKCDVRMRTPLQGASRPAIHPVGVNFLSSLQPIAENNE